MNQANIHNGCDLLAAMADTNSTEFTQAAVRKNRLGWLGRVFSFVALGSLAALAIFRPG